MFIERHAPLQSLNTFGIAARAARLVRITSEDDVRAALDAPDIRYAPKFVLGGGSNQKPKLEIYYRKGAPVEYSEDGEVKKDGKSTGDASKGWFIPNVEKGERYYIQFVNVSATAAAAAAISVETSDAPAGSEVTDEDTDATPDDEMSYGDDETPENGGKKKSSGCSLVL